MILVDGILYQSVFFGFICVFIFSLPTGIIIGTFVYLFNLMSSSINYYCPSIIEYKPNKKMYRIVYRYKYKKYFLYRGITWIKKDTYNEIIGNEPKKYSLINRKINNKLTNESILESLRENMRLNITTIISKTEFKYAPIPIFYKFISSLFNISIVETHKYVCLGFDFIFNDLKNIFYH